MATLQDIVRDHLESHGISIRALAKEAGITYPTLLGVVNRGSVPRKSDHRDALREVLDIDEETWSEILMSSTTNGVAVASSMTVTLQELVSQTMYARGMTEQQLAESADVAYSTVMGITRKGSIPREDSLNKVVDVLGLDPDEVTGAVGTSRALRRSGMADQDDDEEEILPLADLVAKHIRGRGQSVGSFAQDLKVGYFTLANFLDSGEPPEDTVALKSLQRMLDVDQRTFDAALDLSRTDPRPADLGPSDSLLGDDANPLQEAMVSFMRDHNMTLKALAKRADLSQVTVSRLVKQGQMPTRATTHIKLQELLGLNPDQYQSLTGKSRSQPSQALTSLDEGDEYEPDEHYEPQSVAEPNEREDAPSPDELIALVRKLGPKQREALKTFLAAMV